ncbi:MAG: hypothetical protein F6K47_21450 [Symploca sp. SIO2E6]|nr:hypothetical protein [Symploca sp. SIO2E6]
MRNTEAGGRRQEAREEEGGIRRYKEVGDMFLVFNWGREAHKRELLRKKAPRQKAPRQKALREADTKSGLDTPVLKKPRNLL